MAEDRNSYKNITKAISLFGGVQILQIIVSIIKNKFVALLIGPVGVGIVGMLTSSTDLISSMTNFGLRTSAVRDVSQAYSTGDTPKISIVITVLRKLIWFTGILGMIITFCFSSLLSEWAFGNNDYSVSIKLIAIVVLFTQLYNGRFVLLQGTFQYKAIAKSALIGNLIGLFIIIPLYYIWKIKAIVPVIIVTSLCSYLAVWFYSRKISFPKIKLSIREFWKEGRLMLVLGMAIALSGVVGTGQIYLLRVYISNYGNILDVGLYTAGIAIASSYVGIVLNAMSSDYAPRLSAVANDANLLSLTINKQATLLITILSPLIVAFIVFIKQLVILLYSTKFIAITTMVEWIMFGMIFRALSWSISFCFIARGEPKTFFLNELLTSFYSLFFSVIGYKLANFTGMGIAFCLTYFCYTIQVYILSRKKFSFHFNHDFFKMVIPQILICMFLFILFRILGYSVYRYIIGAIALTGTLFLSYYYLDKMIGIRHIIRNRINKIRK